MKLYRGRGLTSRSDMPRYSTRLRVCECSIEHRPFCQGAEPPDVSVLVRHCHSDTQPVSCAYMIKSDHMHTPWKRPVRSRGPELPQGFRHGKPPVHGGNGRCSPWRRTVRRIERSERRSRQERSGTPGVVSMMDEATSKVITPSTWINDTSLVVPAKTLFRSACEPSG